MSKIKWTGVVSKGILKLKLSFDSDVSIPDRMKIMESYGEAMTNTEISIIESHHFSDGSQMRAVINNRTNH